MSRTAITALPTIQHCMTHEDEGELLDIANTSFVITPRSDNFNSSHMVEYLIFDNMVLFHGDDWRMFTVILIVVPSIFHKSVKETN
jgi:hypothetical protein